MTDSKQIVLALDGSGTAASAAVVAGGKVVAEIFSDTRLDHSQTLLPTVDQVLRRADVDFADVSFVAVTSGPGSFTGLRIAAATAKGLVFAANKPIVPVPTLTALAYNIVDSECIIAPIMDARRNQAYSAAFAPTHAPLSPFICEQITTIIDNLRKFDKKIIFLGDGVDRFRETIAQSGLPHAFAPPYASRVRASVVAYAATQLVSQSNLEHFSNDFGLVYVRAPQAEREFGKK